MRESLLCVDRGARYAQLSGVSEVEARLGLSRLNRD